MKMATLTLLILSAVCALTYAGPEQYSGKEMKEVAPIAAPTCFNWTGFYVGALGGYKRSNVDADLNLGGAWDLSPLAEKTTNSLGSKNLDNDGAEVGGLIGYNWQFKCWVVGLEASGGYLWARESNDTGAFFPGDGFDELRITSSFKTHYLATFSPRIGYAWGRWLPYVTGGLALGDLHFVQDIHDVSAPPLGERGNKTETNAGWMVGGGLQYALTHHWSVRAQYQYIDLGTVDFDSHFQTFPVFTGHHEVDLTEHNASFAIIYGF
jgi:outer membrane immunogenic protein